jgi:hypothetical protein
MQGGRGQSDRQAVLWAEKSAGAGSYCRASRLGEDAGKSGFIGFFIMAWRLLRNMHELIGRDPSGVVGVPLCSLL